MNMAGIAETGFNKGSTVLHEALYHSNVDLATDLITQALCDINIQNLEGNSALHIAARNNLLEIVKCLIGRDNCNVNLQNENGDTALMIGSQFGLKDVVQLLLSDDRCDVTLQDEDDNTALHHAITCKYGDIVQLLTKHKDFDVHVRDGETLLHYAAMAGDVEITKMIAKHSQCTNDAKHHDACCIFSKQNLYGETAFHKSIRTGHYDVLNYLLTQKCAKYSLHILDKHNESVLSLYIKTFGDCSPFKVKFWTQLDTISLSSRIVNAAPQTLAVAVEKATLVVCETLCKSGANVNSRFPDGETALHCAVRMRSQDKIHFLVKQGARLDVVWKGLDPLQLAIAKGCNSDIIWLLDKNSMQKYLIYTRIQSKSFSCSQLEPKQAPAAKEFEEWCELERICNTKMSANKKANIGDITPEKFCYVAFYCSAPERLKEIKEIVETTMRFFQTVSSFISDQSEMAHLAFSPVLAGSLDEGTKTWIPNELDIVCHFKVLAGLKLRRDRIQVEPGSPWFAMNGGKNYLMPVNVTACFADAFEAGIHDVINQNISFGCLEIGKNALERRDKVSCLRLLWRGRLFKRMVLNVDVVPMFLLYNGAKQVVKLIAKASRHRNTKSILNDEIFQICHVQQDHERIRRLPDFVRKALIAAKAVRLASICQTDDVVRVLMETVDTEDFITSFMLKTCLFQLEEQGVEFTIWEWIDNIYRMLQKNINVAIFPEMESGNLFRCLHVSFKPGEGRFVELDRKTLVHCDDVQVGPDQAACCVRRKIILSMCANIRKWLKVHKSALDRLLDAAQIMPPIKYP